jgi:hypothetical protein
LGSKIKTDMTEAKIKNCQNCKNQFAIESADFNFYQMMKIPPPTFCSTCRLQRRLAYQNQRSLYKRKCNLCGKDIIAMYQENASFPVYCMACWESDKWDPLTYGVSYDFSKPFFTQFTQLMNRVPRKALMGMYSTWHNSEYNNMAQELKNCYLIFNSDFNEGCMYGSEVERSRDCMDITMVDTCDSVFSSTACNNCNKVYFSVDCDESHNIWYSRDLVGCSDCFGCAGLRKKKHCWFNKQLNKEEYQERMAAFKTGSYQAQREVINRTQEIWKSVPHKYMHGRHNADVSGEYINNSKEVHDSYIVFEGQSCRFCMWLVIKPNKDCYDYTQFGQNAKNVYETLTTGANINDIYFTTFSTSNVSRLYYSDSCHNGCADLFGCNGLRNKKYCILNKEYSKEEYAELTEKIREHMNEMPYVDAKGRTYKYGEFFPIEHSPFAYNETDAQEYLPLSKDGALEQGYRWFEFEEKKHQPTISWDKLADDVSQAEDVLTKEVILCRNWDQGKEQAQAQLCTKVYRILSRELELYKHHQMPLPRCCPNCRHYERVKQRNQMDLFDRTCECAGSGENKSGYKNISTHFHGEGACPNKFETSYALDRPEIVYCEDCYQSEVV